MAQRSSGWPSGSSQKSQSMRPVFCDPLFPAASAYLDHYLETVESVPYEVHRNFTLLREIDARTQGYVNRLEEIAKGDLTSLYRMDPTERAHRLADLQSLLETMLQYGHEKDRLAAQTYELVEQHVRKLDMDLESYDLESKEGKRPANLDKPAPLKRAVSKDSSKEKAAPKPKKPKKEPASTLVPANKDQAGQLDRALTPQKHVGTPDTASMVSTASTKAKRSKESAKRPKTENKAKDKEKAVGDSASQAGNEAIGKVSDDEQVGQVATVDQELYCTCRQPSFGEMIGCDNEECKFEWFHFQCMGLTVKPKGNWFCPDCRKKDKK